MTTTNEGPTVVEETDGDPYITEPTHLRIFCDGEWFVDGADQNLAYTEMCWSFDTFEEAVANLADFVRLSQPEITWKWQPGRPATPLRRN